MALHFLVQTGDKENITDKDRFEDRILQINNYIRSNYAQNISPERPVRKAVSVYWIFIEIF